MEYQGDLAGRAESFANYTLQFSRGEIGTKSVRCAPVELIFGSVNEFFDFKCSKNGLQGL